MFTLAIAQRSQKTFFPIDYYTTEYAGTISCWWWTDCRFKALLHCFHFSDPEATSIIYKHQQTCIEFHFKQDLVTVHFVSKNFFSLRRHRSVSLCFSLLCYAQLLKSGLCTDQDSLYLLILYVNVMTVTGCCGHCRSNLVKQILYSK